MYYTVDERLLMKLLFSNESILKTNSRKFFAAICEFEWVNSDSTSEKIAGEIVKFGKSSAYIIFRRVYCFLLKFYAMMFTIHYYRRLNRISTLSKK